MAKRRTARPSKSNQVTASEVAARRQSTVRGEWYLARESNEYDLELLKAMVSQVLSPHQHSKPALKEILEQIDTLLDGSTQGKAARELARVEDFLAPDGSWVGWIFPAGEDRVLVCPASAASEEDEQNRFTSALSAALRTHRPKHLYTGPFSRLGRRVKFLLEVKSALIASSTSFSCAETSNMDLTGDGQLTFSIMSQLSESEWASILRRLAFGMVHSVKRGRLPRGKSAIPLGYTKVQGGPDDGKVVPDLEQWELVNAMLKAAGEETDAEALVKRWDEIGVPRMRWDKRDEGRGETVGSLKAKPSVIVQRRLAWLDVYATGVWEVIISNPLPVGYLEQIHGEDIILNDEDPTYPGHVALDLKVGLPAGEAPTSGGPVQVNEWVDRATVARIRSTWAPTAAGCQSCEGCLSSEDTASCQVRREATARGDAGSPLSRLPSWVEGVHEWRISRFGDMYGVERRSAALQGRPWSVCPGERVAQIRLGEAHAALYDMLTQDSSRVWTKSVANYTIGEVQATQAKLSELKAKADEAHQTAVVLERYVASNPDASDVALLGPLAAEKRQLVLDLEAELERVESSLTAETPLELGEDIRVDSSALFSLASLLDDRVVLPGHARRQLARIFNSTFRARVNGANLVTLEAKVHVPQVSAAGVSTGTVLRFEVSSEVPNRMFKGWEGPTLEARRKEALGTFMASGLTTTELGRQYAWDFRTARAHMRDALSEILPSRKMLSAVLDTPIPEVRAIVWEGLTGERLPVLEALDPGYVNLVRSAYLHSSSDWGQSWATDTHEMRRKVLEYIRTYRDVLPDGLGVPEAETALGLTRTDLNALRAVGREYPPVVTSERWVAHRWSDERRLKAIECPHCAKEGVTAYADHVLRVPEVADAVLCRRCRRMPSRSAVFPEAYLEYWEGPKGRYGDQFSGAVKGAPPIPPKRPTAALTPPLPPEKVA